MRVAVWVLALVLAVFSARYFLVPAVWVPPPLPEVMAELRTPAGEAANQVSPRLLETHPVLLLAHIACGIAAILAGLFQFIPSLRQTRPRTHRAIGVFYVVAVVVGGVMGLALSFLIPGALPVEMRERFLPVVVGFASLSIAWPAVTLMAFARARQHRYDEHRAWMIRSYCVTYAAVSVRLFAPLILFATGDAVTTVNATIFTWPLNLLFAEWVIRRNESSSRRVFESTRSLTGL